MDNDRQIQLLRLAGQHAGMAGWPRTPDGPSRSARAAASRRACLRGLLLLLVSGTVGAAVVRQRPLPPLAGSQLRLVVEFLTVANQLQARYVALGIKGQGADIRQQLKVPHQRASQLLQRMRWELRNRVPPPDLSQLLLHWKTVLDAVITPPSLDVARLMLPMAQEAAAPLQRMLPAYDLRRSRTQDARARRQLLLAELQLHGSGACWSSDFVDWKRLDEQRHTLGTWLDDIGRQGISGLRLQAQWNLFGSALPLRGARCLPDAADTLQSVGDALGQLL